jgi:hypothetical protein
MPRRRRMLRAIKNAASACCAGTAASTLWSIHHTRIQSEFVNGKSKAVA